MELLLRTPLPRRRPQMGRLSPTSPLCATSLLSPNLVAKLVPSKALTDTVATQSLARVLVIRVPEIRRITNEDISYIIMDRVHGVTLEQRWSELDWIAELRKFVRSLDS